ncbi:hypothetical protein GUITHDRAFT_137924 [Guillardia theta CCMP2712]|uniref:Uncharacterized protein n=1 Tax=Guillardia theta (strain CCMP2712) TaxID=905079 RepID=L1JFS7_GUITC|nr:hypothetical protein GUITHDRAFT_137924 [Guillardia theta CCMP2712]EKX46955.1 hypothetical protein GUITHDRAFT_137924 [Guillardia theta CCMP2712]|eukprot:XP_005833935.1 hypothetical protein GUITHDRAFT_137924 [Guillardia theta CCMP2712]
MLPLLPPSLPPSLLLLSNVVVSRAQRKTEAASWKLEEEEGRRALEQYRAMTDLAMAHAAAEGKLVGLDLQVGLLRELVEKEAVAARERERESRRLQQMLEQLDPVKAEEALEQRERRRR